MVTEALGLHGSMMDGPWSYRIASLLVLTPVYSTILMTVGTLAGRHAFFAHVVQRMWYRMFGKKVPPFRPTPPPKSE
jgi:hypothetical protein